MWKGKSVYILSFFFLLLINGNPLPENYEFTRITKTHIQTRAWVLYSNRYPALIILVGTVHMGEESYYKGIMDLLDACDKVFYEDIQPRGFFDKFQHNNKSFPSSALLSLDGDLGNTTGIQMEYAQALDLDYQGKFIRPGKNWVNADASLEEFNKMLEEYRQRNLSLDKNSIDGDITEIKEILQEKEKDPKKVMDYRRVIAQGTSEQANRFYTDEEFRPLFELLIEKRNQIAMKKITKSLKEDRIIGMVYGAAHMPDFLQRLENNLEYQIVNKRWMNAWSFR